MPDVTIFLFFSFSQNDTIGFFMNTEDNSDIESSSDEDEFDLAMPPPIEKGNAETDMGCDASDDMNDGLVQHFPRRLLNSTCGSTKYIRNLCNALNPQLRNQENQLQETGEKALTCSQL